jgi:hypothetical protein
MLGLSFLAKIRKPAFLHKKNSAPKCTGKKRQKRKTCSKTETTEDRKPSIK